MLIPLRVKKFTLTMADTGPFARAARMVRNAGDQPVPANTTELVVHSPSVIPSPLLTAHRLLLREFGFDRSAEDGRLLLNVLAGNELRS